MFGYVIPDKNNMYVKDFNVFQAYYCGLCKQLARTGGPLTRLCTNYDTTFYNALLHSLTDTEVKFERRVCLFNGKKKTVIKADELTAKVADLSVLLVYYNAVDDVHDGKKSRAAVVGTLAARKRAAAKRMPEIDALMKESFRRLSVLESRNSADIDLVADCFASLMRDVTKSSSRRTKTSTFSPTTSADSSIFSTRWTTWKKTRKRADTTLCSRHTASAAARLNF